MRLFFNGFDALTVLTAQGQSPLPIIVVGIDDPSIEQLREHWPWPRRVHAQLIDKLQAEGAAVVAFDIPFSNTTTTEDDAALLTNNADDFARAIARGITDFEGR